MTDNTKNPTTNAATDTLKAFYKALTTQSAIKAGDLVQYKANVPRPDRDLRQGAPGIVTFVFRNPGTNGPGGAQMQVISGFDTDIFALVFALNADGGVVECKIPVHFLEPYTGGVEVQDTEPKIDFASAMQSFINRVSGDDTDQDPDGLSHGGIFRRIRH